MGKNEAGAVGELFGAYWQEPQVLPQGYFVVNSITGKIDTRPARAINATPAQTFSCWNALTDPVRSCDAAITEGYAELSLAITKAIVEVYKHADVVGGAPAGGGGGSEQPTAAHDISKDHPPTDVPPFFPLLRAYINDKAVYQSKVGSLSDAMEQLEGVKKDSSAEWNRSPGSTAPGSPSMPLTLTSVHEVDYNEEVKISVYTPASLLTLQLFEKDFCADISLSEILLASATIPIHILQPGKNLDLVISVHCTLPQYYSLESLTGRESNTNIHEAVAIIARLYVTLTIAMPRGGWNSVLREIAALSLPRGPWTPHAIVDPSVDGDELTAITGCDIFSVTKDTGVLSLMGLCESIGSLIFALTAGFDDLGSEAVVVHLKNTEGQSVEVSQEERMRMTYVAMIEDSITIVVHLIVGPLARFSHFLYEVTHFKRPVASIGVVLALWLPFLTPVSTFLYSITFTWLALFFWTEIGIATKPTADASNKFSTLLAKMQQIQGADMLIRPIEQSINATAIRRLRIIEMWLKAVKTRVLRDAAQTEHFQKSILRFLQNPWRIIAIGLLAYSAKARIAASLCVGLIGTLMFCRHIPAVAASFAFVNGLMRYRALRSARANIQLKHNNSGHGQQHT